MVVEPQGSVASARSLTIPLPAKLALRGGPYETDPANINPLRDILEETISLGGLKRSPTNDLGVRSTFDFDAIPHTIPEQV